jgi:hypothetical protein
MVPGFLFALIVILTPGIAYTESTPYPLPEKRQFLQDWLLCGPFMIDMAAQAEPNEILENTNKHREAFDFDYLNAQGGETAIHPVPGMRHPHQNTNCEWQWTRSQFTPINLWKVYGELEHAVAYAYAEIESPDEREMAFLVGSDDAMKIWINGKQVYRFWGGRAVYNRDDAFIATLSPGTNRVLIKVLNMTREWGFSFEIVHPQEMPVTFAIEQVFSPENMRSEAEIKRRFVIVVTVFFGLVTVILSFFLIRYVRNRKNRS